MFYRTRATFNLGLTFYTYWGKTLLSTLLPNALWILMFFTLVGGNRHYFWSMWAPRIVPSNTFGWVFLHPQTFPHRHKLISTQLNTQRDALQVLEFSLCEALSSLVFCPTKSSFLGLPKVPTLSIHFTEIAKLYLNFPLSELQPRNSIGSKQRQ